MSVSFISADSGLKTSTQGSLQRPDVVVPQADPRVGDERLRLVLEGGEGAQEVDLDEPGGGMVRPDVARRGVGALHGERPVGPVEGEGEPFGLHGKAASVPAAGRPCRFFGHIGRQTQSTSASIPFPATRANSVSPWASWWMKLRTASSFPQVSSRPSVSSRVR